MLKRGLSLFLSIVMVLSLMPLQAFAADDVTEPTGTEPVVTEPMVTEPEASEPVVTEPVVTEPVVTEPVVTEPVVTEPVVTEPVVTEPEVTEPEVTEPEETEPESGITTYPTREDGIPQEGPAYYVQVKPETFTRTEDNRKVVTDEMGHTHYEISAETHETEMMVREEIMTAPISMFSIRGEGNYYYFTTFEDLKELAAGYYESNSYVYAYYEGEEPLVITENITLPENLRLSFYNDNSRLIIDKGVTFTTMEGINTDYLDIRGTFINYGFSNVREELKISGILYLYSSFYLDEETVLNNSGRVITNDSWIHLYRGCTAENTADLKAFAAAAKADTGLQYDIDISLWSDQDFVLTESVTIPSNARFNVYGDEGRTFTIADNVTLTLNGEYNYVDVDTVVHGTLINNSELALANGGTATLTFSETGDYSGTGYIVVTDDDWKNRIIGIESLSIPLWAEEWYYNEEYHVPVWKVFDVTGKTQLATPFEPTWHKMVEVWGNYNEKTGVFTPEEVVESELKGGIAWRAKQPHQGHFDIQIYHEDKNGNISQNGHGWYFENYEKVTDWYSIDSFIMDDPQTGTYWFTVSARADDTKYYSSNTVESGKFEYTKPGKTLGDAENLQWIDTDWGAGFGANWEHPAGITDGAKYEVEFWFAPTLDSKLVHCGNSWGTHWEGSGWNLWDELIQQNGNGYYYFRVRAISNDITKVYNGAWSDFSEPYCLNGTIQNVKDNLDSISPEKDEQTIREEVQAMGTEDLKAAMLADNGTEGIMDSLETLEEAVGGPAEVQVNEEVSAFDAEKISIVGANLNNKADASDEDITLVLSKPEVEHVLDAQYDNSVAIQFAMDLANVENTENLAVPVKITLPIPEGINPDFLVILHYTQSGAVEEISGPFLHVFEENGQLYTSFVLTSFSDFAMTQYLEEEEAGEGDEQFSWAVTSWGKLVISGEGAMPEYDSFEETPWSANADSITSIIVEEGITSISNYAFAGCTSATSISLPDSLTHIGDFAINAFKINEVTIPAGVTSLGIGAIDGSVLKNIYVDEGNTVFCSVDGVLFDKDMTVLLNYPDAKKGTIYNVPEGVERIGAVAFADNWNLTQINLPASLQVLGSVAFCAAVNLEEIWFNGNIPVIAEDAFAELSGVTAFYPATDDTWKEELLPTYGGAVVWQKSAYVEITGENTVVGGKSIKLTAEILPTNEFGKSVFWTLRDGDQAYATLTVSKGVATITAADVSEVNTITVEAYSDESVAPAALQITIRPKVTGLQVGMIETDEDGSHFFVRENETIILNEDQMDGFQMQLGAEGLPYGACSDVTWSASKSAAATVTANGLASFTGASGVVTFTATSKENSKIKGTVTYTVVEPMDVSAVGGTKIDLVGGQKVTLEILNNATGKPVNSKDITWGVYADDADADIYATMKSGKLTTKKVLKKTELVVCADIISDYKLLAQVIYNVTLYPAVTQVKIDVDGTETNGQTVYYDWSDPERNEMTLTAVQYPDDAMPADVTWTISDKNAAYADYSVSGNKITITNPKMAGAVTFTATSNDGSKKKTSVKVQIGSFADEIKFFAAGTEVQNGILYAGNKTMDRVMLEAVVYAKDGSTAVTGSGVKWSLKNAADKSFVTVSAKGLVTAKTVYKQQNVVIVAASKDGMASAEIPITILPSDTSALTVWTTHENGVVSERNVTKDTIVLDMNSENPTVTLQAKFPDGTSTEGVTWTPAKDSAAADITDNGDGTFTVKMLKVGKVNVTAKVGKKSATVTVSATKLAEDIVISQKKTNATGNLKVASGKSLNLQAAVNNATNKKVTWSLKPEDEAYAKVSSSGKVTATKELTVQKTITVYAEAQDGSGQVDDIQVTIYPIAQGVQVSTTKAQAAMLFSMESNDYIISDGNYVWDMAKKDDQGNVMDIITLSALVYPYHQSNTQYSAMQDVTWKSSSPKTADFVRDENGNVVVDENGYVQLKCKNPGSVTITVTANDGSNKKVTFKLKVVRKIQKLSLNLNGSVEVTPYDQIIVQGGKSVDLSKLISYDPAATEKTLYWFEGQGDGEYFASINAKGKVTTSKVTSAKDLYFVVSTENDPAYYNDNAATLLINILIVPG